MFRRINSDTNTRIGKFILNESSLTKYSKSPAQIQNQYHQAQKGHHCNFNDPKKYRVSHISAKKSMKSTCNSKIESTNLIQLYKKENENLKQQNEYLLERLRKYKVNEQNLIRYIKQIQSEQPKHQEEYSNSDISQSAKHKIQVKLSGKNPQSTTKIIQKTKSGVFFNKENNNNNSGQFHQESSIQDLNTLNKQFCKQMKEVSKQTDPEKRKLLRQSMAKLANDMRIIRESLKN